MRAVVLIVRLDEPSTSMRAYACVCVCVCVCVFACTLPLRRRWLLQMSRQAEAAARILSCPHGDSVRQQDAASGAH